MGGVNVESSSGGRRSLDSEINMIPMIDLLMVTISFLLITAVWSHMARLNADAHACSWRIQLLHGYWYAPVGKRRFDMIVSLFRSPAADNSISVRHRTNYAIAA